MNEQPSRFDPEGLWADVLVSQLEALDRFLAMLDTRTRLHLAHDERARVAMQHTRQEMLLLLEELRDERTN